MTKKVTKSIIVKGAASDLFDLWTNFENFPHFMSNVKSVKKQTDKISEWTVSGPVGASVTWTAELTRLEENKRIAWSTKDHSGAVTTSGQVTFTKLPEDETEVTVTFNYAPAGGKVGEVLAEWLANPDERLEADLRNFKQFAEGMYDRTP